jgi:hypothetical protein
MRVSRADAFRGLSAANAGRVSVYSLVALALGLRLAYYLIDPTLSTDEAQLALNIMHHSYSGFVRPLDFNQAAPLGFLFVQKFVIGVLGPSEYALRLFPLVSAFAASILFYPVASKFVPRKVATLALVLFAVSGWLLFYAATNKQYSTDVAVALALYATVFWVGDTLGRRQVGVLALAGSTFVWFSHPAIFVEAGVAGVLIVNSLLAHQWGRVRRLMLVAAAWLASFGGFYLSTRSTFAHLQESFAGGSAQFGVAGAGDSSSRASAYGGTVRALLGVPHFGAPVRDGLTLIGSLLCVAGFSALLARRPARAFLLVAPMPFVLLASAIGKYPLFLRTLLFLVPGVLILLAYGVQFLVQHARVRPLKAAVGAAFSALLVATAVAPANHLRLQDGGELKQAMRYVADNQRPTDSLYVYSRAQYDVRYYLECGCFASRSTVRRARALWPLLPAPGSLDQWPPAMRSVLPRIVIGKSTSTVPTDYRPDFAHLLRRPRVWILLAAAPSGSTRALNSFLDHAGTREKTFGSNEDVAAAELYDLSR